MNKADLVELAVEKLRETDPKLSKNAIGRVIDALTHSIVESVAAENKVTLIGFGTFEPRSRKAREGRNPSTGEVLQIPATVVPVFSPGKTFKESVKEHAKIGA